MDRPVTIILAGALVAVFVYEMAVGAAGDEAALVRLGALRTRNWAAADCWRVLTFSFLHLTAVHLFLNIAALLWLGGIVERRLGSTGILAVFAVSAITSGVAGMLLGSILPTTGIAVGASGAVYGLLAASLTLVVRNAPPATDDRRLRRALVNVFVIAVIVSFVPGVSLAGHLGGFVGGGLVTRSIGF